jgi:endonuclease/exonuclease/phosphatase family metal-dependent hydrolase
MTSDYLVNIDAPKNSEGTHDLSDHYPIVVTTANLTLISYNVQLMPTSIIKIQGKYTPEELTKITGEIAEYFISKNADVCCMQELFDNTANSLLERAMLQKGYVATERLGNHFISQLNGGVRTFIKKELVGKLSTDECIYKEKIDYFIGGDAIVRKGITQTSFTKNGVRHHVFNTHLQASYLERSHYSEITLAQCVELIRFIDLQKARGFIHPNDQVIICGDLNIPQPPSDKSNESFLSKKMRYILGPQYTTLELLVKPEGPQYTLSSLNSYNKYIKDEFDVNLDVAIRYNPVTTEAELIDSELAEIYSEIQLALSYYVKNNATFLSRWLLSPGKKAQVASFNNQFQNLMQNADIIKAQGKNPLDNTPWFKEAVNLLKGPQSELAELTPVQSKKDKVVENTHMSTMLTTDDNLPLENITQCKAKFDVLMFNLRQLHHDLHTSYVINPKHYEAMFVCSLELNHILLNKGTDFFKHPTPRSLKEFERACIKHLHEAQELFQEESDLFNLLHPIFRSLFALIAAASVIIAALVSLTSEKGFIDTFFSPSTHEKMKKITDTFNSTPEPDKSDGTVVNMRSH